MLTFQWETVQEALDSGLDAITRTHWNEVENQDMHIAMDWEALKVAENNDVYKLFTARRAGVLVGYVLFVFWSPVTNIDAVFAQVEAIYIVKSETNRARLWFRLLDTAITHFTRPVNLCIKMKPAFERRMGSILAHRYNMKPIDVIYHTELK